MIFDSAAALAYLIEAYGEVPGRLGLACTTSSGGMEYDAFQRADDAVGWAARHDNAEGVYVRCTTLVERDDMISSGRGGEADSA